MTRRTRQLVLISLTVGLSLVIAWVVLQAMVIRPAIGAQEASRIPLALACAEQMRSGMSKKEVERRRGVDLRLFHGTETGPPPGEGWIRVDSDDGTVWKRDGGKYEIAAWNGEQWAVLHVDMPVASTLALALGAAGLPVVILVFGWSQRASRQRDEADDVLARMAAGHLDARLDEHSGHRESRRVARAINRLAGQLQGLMASDKQRMAGLSHELRTPLTRIRLELELARREGGSAERLDRIERDIEAFDAMLGEMLDLSRLELVGGDFLQPEVVDLAGLAQVVVDEEGWGAVTLRGHGLASVDPALVRRLISNLLRNSVQHAPEAQRWVEVGDGELSVGDDGPGLPVDQHDGALKPFRRGPASRGHGLGLAIVAQIAELHGASLSLSAPPGLVVRIVFPSGAPDDPGRSA